MVWATSMGEGLQQCSVCTAHVPTVARAWYCYNSLQLAGLSAGVTLPDWMA